jgi:hypothetical protein
MYISVLNLFSGSRHQMYIVVINLFSCSRHHICISVFNLFIGFGHQIYMKWWSWLCLSGSWFTTTHANSSYHFLRCEFEFSSWRGVLDRILRDKVCQGLATGRWFSLGTPVSSAN